MGVNQLTMYRGDDKTFNLTITDSDGVAVNITGYKFFLTIKSSADDTDVNAIIQKQVSSHDDAENGQTSISIDASESENFEPGKYNYDIQQIDGEGEITTLVSDDFVIYADITRANE